jgi:hypothetical protein
VGDTWQNESMRATPGRYFPERPRQASRVIDTVTDLNQTLMCTGA